MTTQRCECSGQPHMKYSDAAPLSAPDVSSFVTYLSPEFQEENDDGTDLPLPNIADLVSPATEPRGRRSRSGKPLRDTVANADPDAADQVTIDGPDNSEPDTAIESTTSPLVTAEQEMSSADTAAEPTPSGKRRPRRRRRGGRGSGQQKSDKCSTNKPDRQPAAATQSTADISDTPSSEPAESGHSAETQTSRPISEAAQGEDAVTGSTELDEGKSSPRRRRRRRGPRKKKKPNSGNDSGGVESSRPNGSNS